MAIQTPTAPPPAEETVTRPAPPPGWYDNPTGPGQRYWDGEKWTDSYSQPAQPVVAAPAAKAGWSTGWLVFGYVFAAMGGLIGFITGLVAVFNSDPRTRKHGIAMMVISVVAAIIWIAIASSA